MAVYIQSFGFLSPDAGTPTLGNQACRETSINVHISGLFLVTVAEIKKRDDHVSFNPTIFLINLLKILGVNRLLSAYILVYIL